MPDIHLENQKRVCNALTVVEGQSSVTFEGRLWAVEGDPNTHMDGRLIASTMDITIEGRRVIVHLPDIATPDDLFHPPSETQTGEGYAAVTVY